MSWTIIEFLGRGLIAFSTLKYIFRTETLDEWLFLVVSAVLTVWVFLPPIYRWSNESK